MPHRGDHISFLLELMSHCHYAEDLDAASHFVFHPRLNGASSTCILCGNATDDDDDNAAKGVWPQDDHGHSSTCAYAMRRRALEPRRGELQRHIDRA